ncbi:MAG TPA: hypothetical protein VM123_21280 [archaeon]|nr:hypothetical protein [archaeon]
MNRPVYHRLISLILFVLIISCSDNDSPLAPEEPPEPPVVKKPVIWPLALGASWKYSLYVRKFPSAGDWFSNTDEIQNGLMEIEVTGERLVADTIWYKLEKTVFVDTIYRIKYRFEFDTMFEEERDSTFNYNYTEKETRSFFFLDDTLWLFSEEGMQYVMPGELIEGGWIDLSLLTYVFNPGRVEKGRESGNYYVYSIVFSSSNMERTTTKVYFLKGTGLFRLNYEFIHSSLEAHSQNYYKYELYLLEYTPGEQEQ